MDKVKKLGQVFTGEDIVNMMLELRENNGTVLEPSAGHGAFSDLIEDVVAIEYDPEICPPHMINMDFLEYSLDNKFDTIIGNPPYVSYLNVVPDVKNNYRKNSLIDGRGNLCWRFIEKCYDHLNDKGEMIFIVPIELLKATSAKKLNTFLVKNGSFTHLYHMGENAFEGFSPNTIIFRYVKGVKDLETIGYWEGTRKVQDMEGQLVWAENEYSIPFSDFFTVKVGGASGADKLFEHENGNKDFIVSSTATTGETKKMFYNVKAPELEKIKSLLLERRIKTFTEDNWWEWGRKYHESDLPRVYVNSKTRNLNPFFTHSSDAYSGSILAIFIKTDHSPTEVAKALNELNWEELGFYSEGRFAFTQRALQNILLPTNFLDS
jgi:adenine-specific DNA-methyltransferase